MTSRHRIAGLRDLMLSVGAVLGTAVFLVMVGGLAVGVRPVVITSGSMEPTISTGAMVVSRSVSADDVAVGDVVTVRTTTGSRVTHRVVEISGDGGVVTLRLKGDANADPDPVSYPATEVGKAVVDVPYVGYLLMAVNTPVGLVVIGGLSALLVLLTLRGNAPRQGLPRTAHRGSRRGSRGRRTAAAATAAVVTVGAQGPADATPWTDDVAVSGSAFTAYDVPKPTIQSCTVTGPALGQKTATIVWADVSTPYQLNYSAIIVETGQSMVVTDNGATRQTQFSAGLLSTVLNATYNVRVTASLPAPGGTWTDTSNQPVTIGLLGISLTCGAAN
ncbi:signal peptidase I [Nocardioides humilatus]|uniref:Signal peptidase I n=1 Tax=Nocardioides humilatus TaxID=2607660 RepID=A0A5B1L3V4_9ACTN|nr:signal peptidase I [Nocardioides humilatus]KAA1415333.1 signal peptidase I [Nocardioides humilatus]